MFKKIIVISLTLGLLLGGSIAQVTPIQNSVIEVQAKAKIKLNVTKKTIDKGKTYTLKVSGTSKKVKWSSSNKSVATVSSKGKVTTKKAGTATISAKVDGKTLKCKITVKNPIKINVTSKTLYKGNTYTLKITGTSKKVTWSSSNTSVATVSSTGKVTAKNAGTATISAKVDGKTLKCKITVKNSNTANDQAVRKAKSYLEIIPFSRQGLIKQLEYDGFTHSQAVYGVDHCGANWNAQAFRKAKSYLEIMSFSRQRLIDQLEYDGFTYSQAVYGVDHCGVIWDE